MTFGMIYTITSGNMTAKISTMGGELCSLIKDGREYLWQAGDAWNRHAPILYPFICSPKDKAYLAGAKQYKMKANHGFARDLEFQPVHIADDFVVLCLEDNIETKSQYPYRFKLYVKYCFENGRLVNSFRVVNPSDKTTYFYLGGHPAFNCPLDEGLSFDDYYVEYEKNEDVVQRLDGGKEIEILKNDSKIPLTRAIFDNDVIMKDAPNSKAVSLKSDKGESSVTLYYPQSNCIAVWSPTANDDAKFVCLEPWTSVPVYCDDEFPDIEKKPHAISLQPGETFDYRYDIEVR